jgi:competence protein ComGC
MGIMNPQRKGFVKYEVVVATLFVAVMTACMVFVMSKKLQGAREAACARNIKMITRQLKVWSAEKGKYPQTTREMDRFTRELFPDGNPICPVTGSDTSYTIDIVTHEVRCDHWERTKSK